MNYLITGGFGGTMVGCKTYDREVVDSTPSCVTINLDEWLLADRRTILLYNQQHDI